MGNTNQIVYINVPPNQYAIDIRSGSDNKNDGTTATIEPSSPIDIKQASRVCPDGFLLDSNNDCRQIFTSN